MSAVRNIPYGIQQPAVSAQVAQLEESLGVVLFHRRPFALTAEGARLFKFIEPFFSKLDEVAGELQGGRARHVRIGASTIVLRDHMPDFFRKLRANFPDLRISLREGHQGELEGLLQADELDLAVTVIERKPHPGIHSLPLLELPLVLLVEKTSLINSADQLWGQDRITERLICLPRAENICKNFQTGLGRLKVDWFPAIEVSSIHLIETYVSSGFGIGLSVQIPKATVPGGVRFVSLPGFDPVQVGALWRGKPSKLIEALLDQLRSRAKHLAG